jgi:hypothetical protein
MLDTATAFFLAGERCAPDLEFGTYGTHNVSAPRIVSYTLAVEIALKLLAHLAGIAQGGHGLRSLFDSLPVNTRSQLGYLGECVDEIDRYFVDWRYPYETDFLIGDFTAPRRSFIECYNEIRRQMPELKSVYERNWGKFDPDWNWAWPELEIAALERQP